MMVEDLGFQVNIFQFGVLRGGIISSLSQLDSYQEDCSRC